MLALVAVLLASLFGIAALVIDLGLAGASHLELENAADAAILGVAEDSHSEAARAQYAQAAARGVPIALGEPRAVSDASGRRGFERRVPLLFGQGSMLAFASPELGEELLYRRRDGEFVPHLEGGGLRESGFPAAATQVLRRERSEPALRVGAAHAAMPGRADLAIDAACWTGAASAVVFTPSAGSDALALAHVEPPEAAPSAACPASAAAWALTPSGAVQWIGDRVGVEIETRADVPAEAATAYVPLFASGTRRVIAFGRARVRAAAGGGVAVEPLLGGPARNASALRVSTTIDAARDERLAAAFGERARWLEMYPGADSAWLRAPRLGPEVP